MARISSDQIGLRDAADTFGVSIDTLRRRIRDNQLDEALLVQGPFGATWVLPKGSLALIAEREGWGFEDVSRVSPPLQPSATEVTVASRPTPAPTAPEPEIDLRSSQETPLPTQVQQTSRVSLAVAGAAGPVLADSGAEVQDAASGALGVEQLSAVIATEIERGLALNVQSELAAVREAITAAEVRAVASEARTDSLRAEKGRLEAQLKRAEADVEYWRSQHDRLDKDVDRERAIRQSAETSKAVAETEAQEARGRVIDLDSQLSSTQDRERTLISQEARLVAELDQTSMAMGWWSRRRLTKLQARSAGRTPPPPSGD